MKPCCLLSTQCSTIFKVLTFIGFCLVTAISQAQMFDSYSVEVGTKSDSRMYKLAGQKMLSNSYSFLADNHLQPYIEANVAQIRNTKYQDITGQSQSLMDVGLTPVLRWQPDVKKGIFGEIGIGVHYLSRIYDNAGQVMGSRFQFGDHIGIGYKFSNSLEITLKYFHFSNAGIKDPNPAVNFAAIKIAYSF